MQDQCTRQSREVNLYNLQKAPRLDRGLDMVCRGDRLANASTIRHRYVLGDNLFVERKGTVFFVVREKLVFLDPTVLKPFVEFCFVFGNVCDRKSSPVHAHGFGAMTIDIYRLNGPYVLSVCSGSVICQFARCTSLEVSTYGMPSYAMVQS